MANERLFHIGIKAMIENDKDEILLMHESGANHRPPMDDYWDLPGGRMSEGENALQTLNREIEEETGITKFDNPKFKTAVISNHEIKLSDIITVGIALMVYEVTVSPNAKITLSDEHIGYEWVSRAEAKTRLAHKYPKEFTDQL